MQNEEKLKQLICKANAYLVGRKQHKQDDFQETMESIVDIIRSQSSSILELSELNKKNKELQINFDELLRKQCNIEYEIKSMIKMPNNNIDEVMFIIKNSLTNENKLILYKNISDNLFMYQQELIKEKQDAINSLLEHAESINTFIKKIKKKSNSKLS